MMLSTAGLLHLCYCTNIHRGETWEEIDANLRRYLPAVKSLVAPHDPFGVGLRLSCRAAERLQDPGEMARFRAFLQEGDLYVFTINGFPYGPFHGQPVKEAVYAPDWRDERRLHYTNRLASLLADLLPDEFPNLEGSISTVPGAYRTAEDDEDCDRMADLLLRHVAVLHRIREDRGRLISLALEPEPCCRLETVADSVGFFTRWLFSDSASARVSRMIGLGRGECGEVIRRHLGVCFDACHMAVEYEEPAAALDALARAGIRIAKIQLSAGLSAHFDGGEEDRRRLAALRRFDEPVYLHQVVVRRDGCFRRYRDLPEALSAQEDTAGTEWRVHVHVPLYCGEMEPFRNTQDFLRTLLALIRTRPPTRHLEVETYTWDVLPSEYRSQDVAAAIAREMNWVVEQMTSHAASVPIGKPA
jgi:sugar phosphate isomerase/epimerase